MSIGIGYKLFKHLNPTKLKPFGKAHDISFDRRMQETEMLAYMNGIYVARSIGCTLGKAKYPEKPLGLFKTEKQDKELTEDEKKKELDALMLNLDIMKANFEISKTSK